LALGGHRNRYGQCAVAIEMPAFGDWTDWLFW